MEERPVEQHIHCQAADAVVGRFRFAFDGRRVCVAAWRRRRYHRRPATPVGTSALGARAGERSAAARPWRGDFRRGSPAPPGAPWRLSQPCRRTVDDVVYTFFPAPHSYTGDDLLEISCHGNPFIAQSSWRIFRPRLPAGRTRRIHQARVSQRPHGPEPGRGGRRPDRRAQRAGAGRRQPAAPRRAGPPDAGDDRPARSTCSPGSRPRIDFPEEDLPPEDRAALRRRTRGACRPTPRGSWPPTVTAHCSATA